MTTQLEGNTLIAEFKKEGIWQVYTKGRSKPHWNETWENKEDCDRSIGVLEELGLESMFIPPDYHSSWDWLMPVVEKIRSMHLRVTLDNDSTDISSCGVEDPQYPWLEKFKDIYVAFKSGHEMTSLELTWIAVVKFIQWYNQNKS